KLVANEHNIKGANINGNTPLHLAVLSENPDAVQFLLEKGADTKAVNNNGRAPMEVAELKGCEEIMQLLSGEKRFQQEKDNPIAPNEEIELTQSRSFTSRVMAKSLQIEIDKNTKM
ncbi:MAG: Ankyrin repeat (many copies), partial [Rickettsiaceae bacterium]|nr:Ankyrin repeat (many copies) [Rickettsiaceae bacterium]